MAASAFRRRADPVQKRVPGEREVCKRGLTETGPLQKGVQNRVARRSGVRNGAARFCARCRPCDAPLHTLHPFYDAVALIVRKAVWTDTILGQP